MKGNKCICLFLAIFLIPLCKQFKVSAIDDDYGNTKETATEIFLSQTINGVLETAEDYDFFKFIAPEKATYSFDCKGVYFAIYYTTGKIPNYDLKPKDKIFLEQGEICYIQAYPNSYTPLTYSITPIHLSGIKGEVILPKPNPNSLYLTVNAQKNEWDYSENSFTPVIIPAGATSVPYELFLDYNVNYTFSYRVATAKGYVNMGYYSEDGMTKTFNSGTHYILAQNENKIVNLTLIESGDVLGSISLPFGKYAPTGGMKVTVTAYYDNVSTPPAECVIDEGYNNGTYIISVPPDKTASLKYEIVSGGTGYLNYGYFSYTGTKVNEENKSYFTTITNNNTYIDLMLLPTGTVDNPQTPITISNFNKTNGDNGEKTINATFTNTSTNTYDAFVIISAYQDKKLICAKVINKKFNSLERYYGTFKINIPDSFGNYSIKAFVLNGMNIIEPLSIPFV